MATKTLNKVQVEIDEDRSGHTRPSRLAVAEWADEFERITEGRVRTGDLKPRTLEGYRETLELARTAIGDVPLREVGPSDLRDFAEQFEGTSPASRLRHLRQLAVCFAAAVDEGHLTMNPVTAFTKKLRLRAPKRGKAPFEVGELERLWTALGAYEPVYLYVARFALETGARLGEVVALDWEAVDLTQGRVRIAHSWDATAGLVPPKSGQERVVYLTSEARAVLEDWVRVVGTQTEGPVFPNPFSGGRLNPRMMQRRLETAMADAGIPRSPPGAPVAPLVPLAALLDVRRHAAPRQASAPDRADTRPLVARADLWRLRRLDTRAVGGGGVARDRGYDLGARGSACSRPRPRRGFSALGSRVFQAIDAAREAKESTRGSFDLIVARLGQRTNDIMKILTLVTVILLPATVLAGVMGMNFQLHLFDLSGCSGL